MESVVPRNSSNSWSNLFWMRYCVVFWCTVCISFTPQCPIYLGKCIESTTGTNILSTPRTTTSVVSQRFSFVVISTLSLATELLHIMDTINTVGKFLAATFPPAQSNLLLIHSLLTYPMKIGYPKRKMFIFQASIFSGVFAGKELLSLNLFWGF